MFERIPADLRAYPQWVVWRLEYKSHVGDGLKPTKVPYSPWTKGKASVQDPRTWSTFDQAVAAGPFAPYDYVFDPAIEAQYSGFSGIGFVLTENDPFGFIDLDDAHGDPEDFARQKRIHEAFDSYTELSPSRAGLHIIIRGSLPAGRRRSQIEIYSKERYMTMTGDVYDDKPIQDRNELFNLLFEEMGGDVKTYIAGVDKPQTKSDDEIISLASSAKNGEKFDALFNGDWSPYYGDDQSRADFALVDILAYYTKNKDQIARLFMRSQLGQRDKAKRRPAYVATMVERSFDRQLPDVDIEGLSAQWAQILATGSQSAVYHMEPAPEPRVDPSVGSQIFPPGLVGDIAQFILNQAPRPVPMIALAGAIAIMAGVAGRAWNISGTGLNHYVLLVAPTGTGKEAIKSGASKLFGSIAQQVPASVDFSGPGDLASGAALIKWLAKRPCFVSILGEFGLRIKQMSSPNAPAHEVGLRRIILDLFNKSGHTDTFNPIAYSDSDKNTTTIQSPAFTMLGESTPERLFGALDEAMITEGLLPRFTIFEYNGQRPAFVKDAHKVQPGRQLIENFGTLAAYALSLSNSGKVMNVTLQPDVEVLFDEFDRYCDAKINAADGEVVRNLWNRAHVKSLKLAGLIAVGVYPFDPRVTYDVGLWAINTIQAEINAIIWRFERGEIGEAATVSSNEQRQMQDVLRVIREYCTNPYETFKQYGGTFEMHRDKVVPFDHIQRRLATLGAFKNDRLGATAAIRRCVMLLVEADDIREIPKKTMTEVYGKASKAYSVFNVNRFYGRG